MAGAVTDIYLARNSDSDGHPHLGEDRQGDGRENGGDLEVHALPYQL
jgi:hypothetical protein